MNLEKYLSITPEIEEAIKAGKPVVALACLSLKT